MPTFNEAPEGVSRADLLLAADRIGAVRLSSPKLAAAAGVSQTAAWAWIHGRGCHEEAARRLRVVLGMDAADEELTE